MATKDQQISPLKQKRYDKAVHQLRLNDINTLAKLCKMHLSFLLDMDNERFEELFGYPDSQSDDKAKCSSSRLKKKCKY